MSVCSSLLVPERVRSNGRPDADSFVVKTSGLTSIRVRERRSPAPVEWPKCTCQVHMNGLTHGAASCASGQHPRITYVTEPWADAPLKDPNKDKLERGPFVEMVSRLINGLADSNDSAVLGLVGAWGSGKSTVLHYVARQLDNTIKVVRFNPWSFDDDTGLQAELYSSLLEAFPLGSHTSIRKKATEVLRRGAPALKAIPFVGAAASETVAEFLPSKSWDAAFDELAKAIHEASVKILVVVDDVDRLQPKELLLLMKAVRLLGRFPRVNYLLAFDRNSTINTLRIALGAEREAAEDYLEKIVQYPLDLPAPQQRFLQEIVFAELVPVLDGVSANMYFPTSRYRFEAFYRDHMWTALNTPRACHRFALQAKTFLPLAGGNVDPVDFFALTFFRLFYPSLYTKLPTWRDALIRQRSSPEQREKTSREEWLQRVMGCGYSKDVAEDLVDAMSTIFPQAVPNEFSASIPGGNYRVSDREYFDRYFTFSLPAGDISDVVVRRDLELIIGGGIQLGATCPDSFDHAVPDMQMLAVRKGMRHTVYEVDTSRLVHFLSFALSRDPIDYESAVDAAHLKSDWFQKLIERQGMWPAKDMDDLVKRFHRPAALGVALVRVLAYSGVSPFSQEGTVSEGSSGPEVASTPSFAGNLASLWIPLAASWLLHEWQTETTDTPDVERLDVWGSIASLGGLNELQKLTADALTSGSLTLSQLVSKFVLPQRILGDHRASPSDLILDLNKLVDTVPRTLLLSLPLDETGAPPSTDDQGAAKPDRIQLGVQGLRNWRAEQPE